MVDDVTLDQITLLPPAELLEPLFAAVRALEAAGHHGVYRVSGSSYVVIPESLVKNLMDRARWSGELDKPGGHVTVEFPSLVGWPPTSESAG